MDAGSSTATAPPPTAQDTLRALEGARQRLSQLTHSLGSLYESIQRSDPLPPWPSLHASAAVIATNLASATDLLARQHGALSALHVYPLPSFPGRAHEELLSQLLRKKLEPGVEDWVEEARKSAEEVLAPSSDGAGDGDAMFRELWAWALPRARALRSRHPFLVGDYTAEEMAREGGVGAVRTGLRRKLRVGKVGKVKRMDEEGESGDYDEDEEDEDEEEEENEEGDKMVVDEVPEKEPMPMSAIHRAMTTGLMPS